MFQSIWDDVKREFQYGNMVTRIIIANCAVFVALHLIKIGFQITGNAIGFEDFLAFFTMPQSLSYLIRHPWTLITAGFTHMDFPHIFWNMLTFYWFGRIVGDLLGNHRILPLYILAVIVGNIVFFISANTVISSPYALGASAAIMAMMACAAFVAPDYIFHLLLIGPVKLKYIALVLMFLDIIAISNGVNAGGSFAHLGGAAIGLAYAYNLRNGVDLAKPINLIITAITNFFKGNKQKSFKYERGDKAYARTEKKAQSTTAKGNRKSDTEGGNDQEKLDKILDKIKEQGYESLSKEERDFLFNASKK